MVQNLIDNGTRSVDSTAVGNNHLVVCILFGRLRVAPEHTIDREGGIARCTQSPLMVELDDGKVLDLLLGQGEADPAFDSMDDTNGYGHFSPSQCMSFLEEHMGHMVMLRLDNQSLNSTDLAVDRMHMVAATHRNRAQGRGIECDGTRHAPSLTPTPIV
jgi:hypothetical protein